MLIGVSFLKNTNGERQTILDIDKSEADYIHVDVMDGVFVNNKTFSCEEFIDLLQGVNKPLDIHLMVEHPMEYIKEFVKLNPKYITFHVEIKDDIREIINYLHMHNIKVGIALNPDTRIYSVIPYLHNVDLVLVMSVYPGQGGQSFIEQSVNKINELKAIGKKYHYLINVDGGINNETIKKVNSDMAVSGSYVVSASDYNERIALLKNSKTSK